MNAAIIYHSSTGNTRHCAEVIREEFLKAGKPCDLLDVRQARQADWTAYSLLGFASPVYGFRPAHVMLEFLRDAPEIRQKPVFLLTCSALIPANSLHWMARMLRKKGAHILGGIEIRGEDAWPAIRFPGLILGKGRPNAEDDETMRRFAADLLDRYARFLSGQPALAPHFRRWSPWGLLGLVTVRPVMRYGMLGKKLRQEACTRCGLCAERCPTGAIRLSPYPEFGPQCMGCFACVNLCPTEAISTPLTWGRLRYKGYRAQNPA